MSQNNENVEKNTAVTAKSHQTILKSYSHFSEKSENFNIFQSKKIIDLECQIKDLKELIELGQHDKNDLNRQISELRELVITMTAALTNKLDLINIENPITSRSYNQQ